ncbi:MAG: hypothetical protein ACK4RK_01745 [Gemmataceae bacterium]
MKTICRGLLWTALLTAGCHNPAKHLGPNIAPGKPLSKPDVEQTTAAKPVTPQQITEDNAYDMAKALLREIEHDGPTMPLAQTAIRADR